MYTILYISSATFIYFYVLAYSYNKTPLDALISEIYFWIKTLHDLDSSCVHHQEFFTVHNSGICHTGLLTACEQFRPDSARKLSANLYDIHHCCVYSEKLLMDGGTVRNI